MGSGAGGSKGGRANQDRAKNSAKTSAGERDGAATAQRKGRRGAQASASGADGGRATRRAARACFRISASAVIMREDHILLARRRDIGWWNLPGGGVEHGETVEEGLRREVREEVHAEIDIVRLIGVYSKPQKDEVMLAFLCALAPGQAQALSTSEEVSEVGWFTKDTLPDDLLPKHRQRVLDAVSGAVAAILRDQRTTTEQDQRLDADESTLV